MAKLDLHEDRLLPADKATRSVARRLYAEIKDLPIISPHGHTDPAWFAYNENFPNPADLLITPDHYVFRMLYSQGVALEDLGVPMTPGQGREKGGAGAGNGPAPDLGTLCRTLSPISRDPVAHVARLGLFGSFRAYRASEPGNGRALL